MLAGWERVGAQITRARSRLGYRTRAEFAHAAGVSIRVLDDLENGKRSSYRASTIARVEAALGWAEGSIERTVEGRRPIRNHDTDLQLIIEAWPHLSRGERAMLARLVREARSAH